MEHEYWRSRERDERRLWAPLAIVGAAFVALLLALVIVFGDDDGAASIPVTALEASTSPATSAPATTVAPTVAAPPPIVIPPADDEVATGDGSATSTLPSAGDGDPEIALQRVAVESGATDVSDIVPIGSGTYAFLTIAGSGRLLRWSGVEWVREATIDPPGAIRAVTTVDVTNDGVDDFVVMLSGLQRPGGVYSRATFAFGWLVFQTATGQQNLVNHLELQAGQLVSDDIDSLGRPITVAWRWTGDQFEPR